MRKILPILLLAGFTSNAQLRERGTVEIIPEIGYSSFMLYDNTVNHTSSLDSANFGVAGDYYFSDRWSLRSGLLFQTMGGVSSSATDKLNYLNIPVNANWHFGSTRKWNLNFGLTPSFLLSAKENGTDISELVQNAQLGLTYGIGYKLEMTKDFSLLFDFQGFGGLSNTARVSGLVLKNSGSSFNLGGVFHLK